MSKKDFSILFCLLFSFILIGILSINNLMIGFDTFIYNSIHLIPKSIALPFFKSITVFGDVSFCIGLLIVLLFILKKQSIYCILTSITSAITNKVLKHIFKRNRPSFPHLVKAGGYSFPSGHTMISVLLYGMLLYLVRNIKNKYIKISISSFLVFLIVCIPLSRIYLGVHYASDIIGGYLIGTFILYLFIVFDKKRGIV